MPNSRDKLFGYEDGVITRVEGKDSFRIMVKLLTDGNEELRLLPVDSVTDRLRVNYELRILALLSCCSTKPKVDTGAMKKQLIQKALESDRAGKTDDGIEIEIFHDALFAVLEKLDLL